MNNNYLLTGNKGDLLTESPGYWDSRDVRGRNFRYNRTGSGIPVFNGG